MNKKLEELLKTLQGLKFKSFPEDTGNLLIGNLQNRAAIKAMQLFILKQFSLLTEKKMNELDEELQSFFASVLADEYSQFLSKRFHGENPKDQ